MAGLEVWCGGRGLRLIECASINRFKFAVPASIRDGGLREDVLNILAFGLALFVRGCEPRVSLCFTRG